MAMPIDVIRTGFYPTPDGVEFGSGHALVSVTHPRIFEHRTLIVVQASYDNGTTWAEFFSVPSIPRDWSRAFNITQPTRLRLLVGPVREPFQIKLEGRG